MSWARLSGWVRKPEGRHTVDWTNALPGTVGPAPIDLRCPDRRLYL